MNPEPGPSARAARARWRRRACAAAAAVLLACPAFALQRGMLASGGAYLAGGIGLDEIEDMARERGAYSFWLVTAARGSGAHLADVRVTIRRAGGELLFDQALDGPWLLADLPAGRYAIEARHQGQVLRGTVTIAARAPLRQLVLYFDLPDEAAGRWPRREP